MIAALLARLGGNLLPCKILAAVLLALALFGGGYVFGRYVLSGEIAQENLARAGETIKETAQAQKAADQVTTEIETKRTDQANADRTITKEVIRYVQVTPRNARCTLPGTWRLLHDAAAFGVPLDPGTGPVADGEAEPVEDAAALETVADNYRQCREWRDKLDGWQRYYAEVIRHGQGDLPGGDSSPEE